MPFRYQGQYEDVEPGLYYNQFRYYDPESGRYLIKDPIGIKGGIRLYNYVGDSNNWLDPLGLDPIWNTGAQRWIDSSKKRFMTRPTDLMKTNPNEAFFWSGRTNGVGGMDVAAEIASKNGGTTLEMLI